MCISGPVSDNPAICPAGRRKRMCPHRRPHLVGRSSHRRLVRGLHLHAAQRHRAVLLRHSRRARPTLRLHLGGARAADLRVLGRRHAHTPGAVAGRSGKTQPFQPLWDSATRLAIPIPLAVGIVGAITWFFGIKRRRSELPASRIAQQFRTVVPYLTVIVVAAVIVRSIVELRYANTATHIGPGEAWLWVGVLAATLLIQSAALSFQKGWKFLLAALHKRWKNRREWSAPAWCRRPRIACEGELTRS